ncbi:hypothetical protein BKA82DRAFT_4368174 [Pisolithus tinctorius]|nr:hypothetical protein BKA82DRAFT_4368174 [Pisolithus tinctorius]
MSSSTLFILKLKHVKAFYSKGEPVLPNPPHLKGVFEHATASQVAPLPTLLVHLHLEILQPTPSPSYLLTWPPKIPRLHTNRQQQAWPPPSPLIQGWSFSSPLTVMKIGVIFFVGYGEDNNPHASQVFQVLQLLLTPLAEIIWGADMMFYVCGSVVTEAQSFNGVNQAAKLFKPRSILLFDAPRFQIPTTAPYLQSLLEKTVIEGFHVRNAVKDALWDCAKLGRHSNTILIVWQEEKLEVEKYIWTDKHLRPWGHHLPVACPQCATMQKWHWGEKGLMALPSQQRHSLSPSLKIPFTLHREKEEHLHGYK